MPLFLSYLHALPYRQLILDCSPFFRLCIPGFFFNLLFVKLCFLSTIKMDETYRPRSKSFSGTNSKRDPIFGSSKRSSSSDRYRSKTTSTFDADHSDDWGPLVRKVPLSSHLKLIKIETITNIDRLLSTFTRQKALALKLNMLQSLRLDTDDVDNIQDNNDNNINQKTLELILRNFESEKPCLFNFFESLAYENTHLGAKIVESCLLGLQRANIDYNDFLYF